MKLNEVLLINSRETSRFAMSPSNPEDKNRMISSNCIPLVPNGWSPNWNALLININHLSTILTETIRIPGDK